MRIRQPQGGSVRFAQAEIAVAVQPRLAGRVDAGGQRRMNAFAGRALTAPLLHAEQDHRGRRLALLQRALSAGVVQNLAFAFDEASIAPIESASQPPLSIDVLRPLLAEACPATLDSGFALSANGEEVLVPQALRFDALALPVMAPGWLLAGEAPPVRPPQADGSVLDSRHLGRSLRAELDAARDIPRAGILVLEAVEHWQVEGADPFDQCERDLEAEAFEDQVRQDAGRLVYYAWPDEWLSLPAPDVAWRNRLAYQIFSREAQLDSAQAMPWHALGVPLALLAFNSAWQPLFADRGAVVRAGGRPRGRALVAMPPSAGPTALRRIAAVGDRFLWQARIEQLAEQLTEARSAGADTAALGAQLPMLPPAGLLPPDAIDVRAKVNRFFASQLDVHATPVPLEQLDLLLEEAAGLAPVDTAVRDRIAVYVPVPQEVFDPHLLVVEQADATGEIGRALARFVDTRGDWLRRRQNLRGKEFVQRRGLEGATATPTLTAADDPQRLEDEAGAPVVPAPAGLLHRSALAQGLHEHALHAAPTPLALRTDDNLYAWVQLDRENPPLQLMLQLEVAGAKYRVCWGANLIALGVEGEASRLQQSASLPNPGTWVRLSVPVDALKLADHEITGLAFTLYAGRACFGPVGLLRGDTEAPWLTSELLKGSRTSGIGEDWDIVDPLDQDAPFEPALGTRITARARESADLADLLDAPDVKSLRIAPSIKRLGDPLGTPEPTLADALTVAALIADHGLRSAVADLSYRIDQADDVINVGYLRAQTDLYRLRQSVLKQTQATRFAVSPALTQIADLDNASATREQLADFYQEIKTDKTILKRPAQAGERAFAAAPTKAAIASRAFTAANIASNATGASLRSTALANAVAAQSVGATSRLSANLGTGLQNDRLLAQSRIDLAGRIADFGPAAPAPPPPVVDADALTGKAEIRTTSIASRMERPRSIEAKDYTVATRYDVVSKLVALGLDMSELTVTGLPVADNTENKPVFDVRTGQPLRTRVKKLADFKGNVAELLDDRDPDPEKSDESSFFYSGVDVSDHTIALLRHAEGVVRRYRDLLEQCTVVLASTEQTLALTAARIGIVERELAEARQDVANARALLAEEVERARGLNALRDGVIAEHVKFLAFARTRVVERAVGDMLSAPVRELDSSLEPDAAPACLADHDDAPADVAAMIDVLRHAPLDWFPALRTHLKLIDRPLVADRLIAALRQPAPVRLSLGTGAVTAQPSRQAALTAVQGNADQVLQARAIAWPQLQVTQAGSVGLNVKLQAIARAASMTDLLAVAAERGELQRRAAAEFERMAAIATCLHARLSGVRAAIRLDWAERFSEFDRVGDLGDLSELPRFGELPREDRDDLRELAGWLRGRADGDNPRAVALMADLVRVCVLAASHSPVGELLGGRLVKPVPLNPGIRLDVLPQLPHKVSLGMQVQLFNGEQLAARAVVEDLVDGVATVRVTQSTGVNLASSLATAVRFVPR